MTDTTEKKARWIWYPCDFEIYHHLLLSCRRQEFGCDYPCAWRVPSPEKTVAFIRDFTAEKDTSFTVVTHSKGMVRIADAKYRVNEEIFIPAGSYRIEVQLFDIEAFPSLFVDSEFLWSDGEWTCEARDTRWLNVCCEPAYYSASDDPRVFPFSYKDISPVSQENVNGGILYDFGEETFGPVRIEDECSAEGITLVYGESREEALDSKWAVIRETLTAEDSRERPARAFRYIFVFANDGREVGISAQYEYIPLEDKAKFDCADSGLNDIWKVCVRTFHLNSREFFLDGIKRDRWVWSGDAYQSFMINRALFADDAITERTITALLGKPPYHMHVNRINDYSAYLILSVLEHYRASGRKAFVMRIWENLKELFRFVVSRLDENGLSCPRHGDWVFIDWGELDMEGPHCAEQILLWKAYLAMTELSEAAGEKNDYSAEAEKLKKTVTEKYWNAEKGAFVDSYESGRDFVSRQTNVFAVLFGFADEKQKQSIIENVFRNPSLPEITTPYFKLYELLALCECGMTEKVYDYILLYWGGMLKLGATSVWEAYDERQSGAGHYGMYGTPYAKSLCHAWGSGPILLLINKIAGIDPVVAADGTFKVCPAENFPVPYRATAPVKDGYVTVEYDGENAKASGNVRGGKLCFKGQISEIPAAE